MEGTMMSGASTSNLENYGKGHYYLLVSQLARFPACNGKTEWGCTGAEVKLKLDEGRGTKTGPAKQKAKFKREFIYQRKCM